MSPSHTPVTPTRGRRQIGRKPHEPLLFRAINRALNTILRSPLHRPISRVLLLVEFTGRKTGKRYRTPVGYRREGNVVTFHILAPWWKNLRDGEPIRIWLRGRLVEATAQVITDPVMVARELTPVLERAPRLAASQGVRMEPDGRANPADLAELARKSAVVAVQIPDPLARILHRTTRNATSAETQSGDAGESMHGKVVLVTGANAGIGKATALALAKRGATVVMVSRSRARGEMAAEEVIARSGNPHVELLVADLASQDAVRQLARDFLALHDRLDVLINNAGVYMPTRRLTAEGLETTLATNYLAPFLLTQLLLPALRAAAPARIVNVSSGAQAWGSLDCGLDVDGLRSVGRYSGLRAYGRSKLALVTWTYELAGRLSGSGVTVNALEPGFVDTKLPGEMIPVPAALARALSRPFMTTPAEGAATSIYLAADPRAESHSGNFFSAKGRPIRSAPQSYDPALARRLWEESARLVDLPVEARSAVPAR